MRKVTMELQRGRQEDLVWYCWPLFEGYPDVAHAIWTRRGGVSQPPYGSLNLSYSVGDAPDHVRQNRRLVQQTMGLDELISVGQVHGANTFILTAQNITAASQGVTGIDILITDLPGVGLLIKQADCQAVALYDPERRVIANIHCGWRGNVANVIGQAVQQLQEVFGSRPGDLRAGISPSLGPCCAQFINYQQEFPPPLWSYQVRPGFFDLWQMSVDQLQQAGLAPGHIQAARVCTRCQAEDFFSYRRDKITGRNGTVLALRRD